MPADGRAGAAGSLFLIVTRRRRASAPHAMAAVTQLRQASTEARHAGTLAPVSRNVHEGELVRAAPRADGVVEYVLRTDERRCSFAPASSSLSASALDSDGNNPILRSYSIASPPGRRRDRAHLEAHQRRPRLRIFRAARAGRSRALHRPDGLLLPRPAARRRRRVRCHGRRHHAGAADDRRALARLPRASGRQSSSTGATVTPRDLFWLDEFRRAPRRVRRPSSCRRVPLGRAAGRLERPRAGASRSALLDDLPRFDNPVFYLVGNGAMIKELKTRAAGARRRSQAAGSATRPSVRCRAATNRRRPPTSHALHRRTALAIGAAATLYLVDGARPWPNLRRAQGYSSPAPQLRGGAPPLHAPVARGHAHRRRRQPARRPALRRAPRRHRRRPHLQHRAPHARRLGRRRRARRCRLRRLRPRALLRLLERSQRRRGLRLGDGRAPRHRAHGALLRGASDARPRRRHRRLPRRRRALAPVARAALVVFVAWQAVPSRAHAPPCSRACPRALRSVAHSR